MSSSGQCSSRKANRLEGHEDGQSAGEPALTKTKGGRSTFPAEDQAQEEPHHFILVLKRQLQRGQRPSIHKKPHGESKWQSVPVALGKASSSYKKESFYSENSKSLEQPPQGYGGVPSLEIFKTSLDKVVDILV